MTPDHYAACSEGLLLIFVNRFIVNSKLKHVIIVHTFKLLPVWIFHLFLKLKDGFKVGDFLRAFASSFSRPGNLIIVNFKQLVVGFIGALEILHHSMTTPVLFEPLFYLWTVTGMQKKIKVYTWGQVFIRKKIMFPVLSQNLWNADRFQLNPIRWATCSEGFPGLCN